MRPNNYPLFKNYSLALVEWLREHCYLDTLAPNNNIDVVFSSIDRAWVNRVMDIANGQNTSGNINVAPPTFEYLQNENVLGFVRQTRKTSTHAEIVKAPLAYKLTFRITIFTRLQSEMDTILYQILSKAHKHAKGVMVVDGQWAQVYAQDPTNESNLEPGDIQDRIVRFGIDIVIPRAYLPLDYEEAELISGVSVDLLPGNTITN